MQLQKMNLITLANIYHTFMMQDFPKSELKPLSMLQKQMEKGNCVGYTLMEDEQVLAYAVFAKANGTNAPILLDYYAVNPNCRGRGIGGICLQLLSKELSDVESILLEVEAVEKATDEAEKMIRKRRISFYLQNGCQTTTIDNCLFGVDFAIMQLPCQKTLSDDEVYAALQDIYQTMLPPERYCTDVKLTKRG